MAITAAERNQIVELTVMLFNAAPGAEYLSQIVSVYESTGRSLQTLANVLAGTPVYQSLYPNTQTADQFADAFLTPLGLQNDALARDFVVAKMNVDENPSTAAAIGVQGIPLIVFLRDGSEAGRLVGAVPKGQIEAAMTRFLGT